ncbi:LysR substrate-binding domain-containing protein [Noviherbaspirillum sp.]|mgnify:CR=1 FL=1|uniref:LysR substrate-binding domain-containing protein n=1 Tax=Noviherbaspirillum sp. TaxID=1926288 RepID=UPI0025CFC475|nr:LysR substrate-binding domain-containing protein [Noviherbaspirillum sp.]
MNNDLANEDLRVFVMVARKASFAGAAEELGMSPAYISKRIGILESVLGVRLFHRTTRRVVVSEDGERVYARAQTILENIDHLYDEVSATRRMPRGQLRICSSFGFGRNVVAPAIAQLIEVYPSLQVRFEVFDRLIDIASDGFDMDIRVGDDIAPHLIAKRLASNYRILCASPRYLARRGTPKTLHELSNHDCLVIKERDHPFGVWKLRSGADEQTVKVTGPLSSNHGEIVVRWAVEGAGIMLRSMWDAGRHIECGELVRILPEYQQEANIWAVYPQRLTGSAKIRVCVEFFQKYFAERQQATSAAGAKPRGTSGRRRAST